MKKFVLFILIFLSFQAVAQQAADAYYDPAVMAAARDNVRQMHGRL